MSHRDCIDTSWRLPGYWLPNILGLGTRRRVPPNLLTRLLTWRERARSRHLLLQLDDRMLRDVGLSRSDADRESAKFFWQL